MLISWVLLIMNQYFLFDRRDFKYDWLGKHIVPNDLLLVHENLYTRSF